jgi:hypothetical protein
VTAGLSGKDESVRKGEGHGWKLGRASEVGHRGEDRLPIRRKTCVAPESARMGEGVVEHNRGG